MGELWLGLTSLGTGLYLFQPRLRLKGKKVTAIIVKNNVKSNDEGTVFHYPVVKFLTDRHEWITQEVNTGSSIPKEEGTELEVLYDPKAPNVVTDNSSLFLKTFPWIFILSGTVVTIVGVLDILGIIYIEHGGGSAIQ